MSKPATPATPARAKPARPGPLTPGAGDVPLRLFGVSGEPVTLAGQPFHLAALTTRGNLDVKRFMTEEAPAWAVGSGDSPGAQFYTGAMLRGNFDFVRALLGRIIAEPLPPYLEEAATRAEIVDCIDRFFVASGLDALAVLLKNSGARQAQALQTLFDAAAQALETEIETEIQRLVREELPGQLVIGGPAGTGSNPPVST